MVLAEIMNERELSQLDLAGLTTLDQNKISRLLRSATRAHCDDLRSLFTAITDPQDRYRLAMAHINDEIPAEALAKLDISFLTREVKDAFKIPDTTSPRLKRAILYLLQEEPGNPALALVFIDLATAFGWEEKVMDAERLPAPRPPSGPVSYKKSKK